jgi:hypothetical protein
VSYRKGGYDFHNWFWPGKALNSFTRNCRGTLSASLGWKNWEMPGSMDAVVQAQALLTFASASPARERRMADWLARQNLPYDIGQKPVDRLASP